MLSIFFRGNFAVESLLHGFPQNTFFHCVNQKALHSLINLLWETQIFLTQVIRLWPLQHIALFLFFATLWTIACSSFVHGITGKCRVVTISSSQSWTHLLHLQFRQILYHMLVGESFTTSRHMCINTRKEMGCEKEGKLASVQSKGKKERLAHWKRQIEIRVTWWSGRRVFWTTCYLGGWVWPAQGKNSTENYLSSRIPLILITHQWI